MIESTSSIPFPRLLWQAGKYGWKRRRLIRCWLKGLRKKNDTIYVSCAQLIRIQIDGKYLLVPNRRIKGQMQPPGGVVKARQTGRAFLTNIGAQPPGEYKSGDDDKGDLRIVLPWTKLVAFIQWYASLEGREIDPAGREFQEELLDTGILPHSIFASPATPRVKTEVIGPRRSDYFNCDELLIHEVHELQDLSQEQIDYLRTTQSEDNCGAKVSPDAQFGWFSRKEILARGHSPGAPQQNWKIGEHTTWMI